MDRVAKTDFNAHIHYLHSSLDKFGETPVLVTGALQPRECEKLCDLVMSESDRVQVSLQRKRNVKNTTNTELYHCTLKQGIHAVMSSTHQDSRLIFQEGLLESHKHFQLVSERISQAQESVFCDDEDWFQHFPSQVKPSSCVIIAGEGATSTLHRDPLEWTGTSLCLEGSKVWRFVPPSPNVTAIDNLLKCYRLDSIAWEDYDIPLSAGWQSDYNLYDRRANEIPSAQSLDEMKPERKWKLTEDIAADLTQLQPNTQISSMWTAVQRPGDLMIIPAHWWHQTYALEPSIAVASQRCGALRDAPRVVHHILEKTCIPIAAEFFFEDW